VTHDELLAVFDREQRREIEFPNIRRELAPHTVRHVVLSGMPGGAFVLYSRADEGNADAVIESEIAYFEGMDLDFEWKAYDHDTPPDLVTRLRAHGFEIEDPEAVMVLDLAHASAALWQPIAQDVRRLTDPAQLVEVASIQEAVWDAKFDWLARALADEMAADCERIRFYMAYADGVPACSAWIRFHPGTQFASLWGGSTLPAYRRRGLYTALLSVRAQEARRRGYRFLTIDASPMSQPIVAKHGFQFLTFAHACKWHTKPKAS
jgi:GNAT superfamily N-acetyltransferase